jgi:hypothetical protein
MRFLSLILLFFTLSVQANYPIVNTGSGVREYTAGIPYSEDEILWLDFDFYRVLTNFTSTNIATDRGPNIEKMVDPLDYLVGLNANVQFQLDNLDGRVTVNEANIAANIANIATNVTNIATNASDISTNQTNIGLNAANIATNVTNIATNVTNITSNDVELADHESRISQNETDIATNSVNIATNVLNISSNDTEILALQTQQALDTAQIATNVADIADHETRLLVVETNTTDAVLGTIDTNSLSAETVSASGGLIALGNLDASGAQDPSKLGPLLTQLNIDAITGQVASDLVYNTDTNRYNYFNGTNWRTLGGLVLVNITTVGPHTASDHTQYLVSINAAVINLPTASIGATVSVKNTGSFQGITVNSADLIDGNAVLTIYSEFENIKLISDGSTWHRI